jgi:uncharacterized membrane protein YphA (DoxX/SURF4 family)
VLNINRKKLPYDVLRVSLALVFLYFGWTSIVNPDMWSGYVPEWTKIIAEAEILVRMHGVVEILFGTMLLFGLHVRLVAFILFLDLVHIITLLEFGSVSVRDFGLAGASLALSLMKGGVAVEN